jgi:hypothetical protein
VRTFPAARRSDARGRSRTVVPVGDVNRGQGFESPCKLFNRCGVGDTPKLVANTIIGCDIDVRLGGRRLRQNGIDLGRVWISAHHWPGLRIDGLDLTHPVVFFQRGRKFVLADPVGRIVGK